VSDRRGTLKQAITNIVDHQDILSRNLNEESLRTDASASTLAEFLIHQDEYIKIESGKKDFSIETSHEYNKLMEKLKTYIHEKIHHFYGRPACRRRFCRRTFL